MITGSMICIESTAGRNCNGDTTCVVLRYDANTSMLPISNNPFNTELTIEIDSEAPIFRLMRICAGAGEMGFYACRIVLTNNGEISNEHWFYIYARSHPKMAEFESLTRDQLASNATHMTAGTGGDEFSFLRISDETKSVDPKAHFLLTYDISFTVSDFFQLRQKLGINEDRPVLLISEFE